MAKDPHRYFRVEARELLEGLSQGVLELEKGAAPEVIARLLRLAHTLKGAARVVRLPEIAELAHTAEGTLTALRESGLPLSAEQGTGLLRMLDEMTSRLGALDPQKKEVAVSPHRSLAEEPLETMRVETREMGSLLRTVTLAEVHLGAARTALAGTARLREVSGALLELLATRAAGGEGEELSLARSLAEEVRAGLGDLQRNLSIDLERVDGAHAELREVVHRLRLVPVQTIFASLDRSVRDAAQTLGKSVAFESSGGEVRLDANVLGAVRDALMHVVRNAVAHGLESEAERVALGKPPIGVVQLHVERRGSKVTFACRDDGRGIDVEAVRKAAVARGLLPAAEARALSAQQVIALLRGGLSTSPEVTELSGRGIGLDVVQTTASKLHGELSLSSELGQGLTVRLQVPVSIASLQGLMVEAAGALAAIPLDAVLQAVRVLDAEVARSPSGDSIVHQGQVIPFVPLERMLRRAGASRSRDAWSAVVVQAGARRVALGIDRLRGTAPIVVRALPGVIQADPVISGVWLDAEGTPQLVLDPGGLVEAAERGVGEAPGTGQARAPVLIIDDSLTTRMLEQSILESAGYEVELALSAGEALAKARVRPYSLFIVDVEMPGMDGFEFVALTRADPVLRAIPAILVTSLNAAEDLRRGEQVGASAYIIKGEFDQGLLLQNIRRLIG